MQLLVSSIDGRLLSFSFPTTHVTLASVKQAFEDREGVPVSELRVSCNGRYLPDEFGFTEEQALGLPPLRVGLRVVGGKGGFGSLLRGGNTKVGQKKTTNFDACRDLNGRRLRHVNNEKRLAEWYAQEKERELARIGERHSRVAQKQASVTPFDEVAYNQTLESIEEEVASSLQVGLQEARAAREHQQANPPPPPSAPSWDFAYSDSEDEDKEEEEEGDSEEEEEEKEEKGKEKEEAEAKSGGKRVRTEEEEEAENRDGEARHTPKKAKTDDSETTTTTAACGKASALPPPPAWILG